MEDKKDLTPKELLEKLKASLADIKPEGTVQPAPEPVEDAPAEDGLHTAGEVSDGEILRAHEDEDVLAIPDETEKVPVIRYRFSVRRPAEAVVRIDEAILPEADELLPEMDTDIEFEEGDAPDMNSLMGDILSPEEIAVLERIGNMPDAEDIAEQARREAEAAFDVGEIAEQMALDAQDSLDGEGPADEEEIPVLSADEEIEAVYAGSEEYYSALDEAARAEEEAEEEAAVSDGIIHDDGSITPDENSRLNAMNYITSLTKKAAADAAAEEAAQLSPEADAEEPAQEDESIPVSAEETAEEEEEAVPAADSAPADFDEVDVNLMLAFGMEEELKDALGEEDAEKVTAQADEDAKAITSTDLLRVVSDEEHTEFTDYSQTKEIFAGFKARYRKTLFSLAGSVLIALLLFLFENIPAMGGSLPQAFDKGNYPLVNIMVGLQLCVFAYALVFPQIKRGVLALIDKKWIPETGTAIVVALSFIYQILMALFCRADYTTYNFPVALCIVLALAYEFMNCKREIYSFNVVASKKVKYALCTLPYDEGEKEREVFRPFYEMPGEQETNEFADELPEAEAELGDVFAGKAMYQLKSGAFIDGFFEKLGRYPSYKAVLRLLLPAAAVLSVLFLLIGLIRAGSFSYGVSLSYFVLAMCAPMSMFVTYSYPLYKASRSAFRSDSAIIGEQAVEEYLDAESVTFEDKDIFPAKGVKVKSIKVYGTHRIDRVVFNAANIFRKYGGPLSQVFNMATLELGVTDDVFFGVIEEDGIEAMVGGNHIYLGKTDYLRRKGYEPGFDDEDEVIEGNGGICVMFMAIDDEVAAKFYVEYTIDPEFEAILRAMYSSGVCIGVRTYDPNIDDRMMQLLLRYEEYPVRVIKCRTEQSPNLAREHMDSGIVSRRSVKDMLRAFMSCDRVLRAVKLGAIVKVVSLIVAAVISVVVAAMAAGGVASVWAALYQLFWLIPLILYSRFTV